MDQATDRETLKRRALIVLDEARMELGMEMSRAKRDYSPGAIMQQSIEKHRWWWILGAAAGGFVVMRSLFHSKTVVLQQGGSGKMAVPEKKRLIPGILVSAIWKLARRPIIEYAKTFLHQYVAEKIANYSPQPSKSEPY
jgi:hypothetical protein